MAESARDDPSDPDELVRIAYETIIPSSFEISFSR